MSRGPGKLQRFIKDRIYEQRRKWDEERAALEAAGSEDSPKSRYWLHWFEIRHLIEADPELNPGPDRMSDHLERSARRALRGLVKRGEVGRVEDVPGRSIYITKECYEDNFSPEAEQRLKTSLERPAVLAQRGGWISAGLLDQILHRVLRATWKGAIASPDEDVGVDSPLARNRQPTSKPDLRRSHG